MKILTLLIVSACLLLGQTASDDSAIPAWLITGHRITTIGSLPPDPPPSKVPSISQSDLDRITHHWRSVLRLNDWDVRAHFVPIEDLPEWAVGSSHPIFETKCLKISVLQPKDYGKASARYGTVTKTPQQIRKDITDTIVHELVHLRIAALTHLTEEDDKRMVEEVIVNRLTSALLDPHAKQ